MHFAAIRFTTCKAMPAVEGDGLVVKYPSTAESVAVTATCLGRHVGGFRQSSSETWQSV